MISPGHGPRYNGLDMTVPHRPSWVVAPPDPEAAALAAALGIHPLAAAVLRRRGITAPHDAQAFLHPRLEQLSDPLSVPRMGAAVETTAAALREGRRVAIHGDYDVDGISATAILTRGLRGLGADPLWYLPHRLQDGYGLGVPAVERLAERGAGLLITVDCGITAHDAVARARSLGLDVVVLDHHTAPAERPPAIIVEPSAETDATPCAAGLALFFMWALRRFLGQGSTPPEDLAAFAALGTVTDVVPLRGDNRRMTAAGLEQMRTRPAAGLAALIEEAALNGPVDAWHIGWQLGPRLNAPGRLGDPTPALRLLLTDDAAEARDLARDLDALNRERQAILEQVLTEASAQAEADASAPALVLAGEGWHPGVVGLVASRLAEQYRRPAVVIALESGAGRGSARSIEGFHLVESLEACRAHLRGFGGHAMAAGLSILPEAVPAFREAFASVAASRLPQEPAGRVYVDAEVTLSDLTLGLAVDLERLAPFGSGNPTPVLAVRGVRTVARRLVGDGAHIRFGVTDGEAFVEAIGFAMAEWGELLTFTGAPVDLAFVLERDRFDPERVRMRLRALEAPGVDPEAILADTGLLLERLFRRASDYLGPRRYGEVEDSPAFYTKVVGVTFDGRQPIVAQSREGDPLRIRREPGNPHDPHAVLITTEDGRPVGYLNAQLAGRLAPSIDMGARYRATVAQITGGGEHHYGMNILLERFEDEPQASAAGARRGWWAIGAAAAIERLPIYLTGGRPLRPAIAEALGIVAQGRSAVLGMAPGRGRAAGIAGAAALAAAAGRWALVVAPLHRQAAHRAEQISARLQPLGLRVRTVHGLMNVRDRERAAAALHAGDVDVIVASQEAARGMALLAPYADRIGVVVLDGLSGEEAAALPAALTDRAVLAVTAASESGALAKAIRGVAVVQDYGPRPVVEIADRRGAADRDAVVEEAVSRGEKIIVYTIRREECVRLAALLRERGEQAGRRIGYLHGGLPVRLRQVIAQTFREARLDALVATSAVDEEALPPDVRQVVLAELPWDREQFLAACGSAGLDRRPVQVTVAFGREDLETRRRALDDCTPGRGMLVRLYRVLRDWKGEAPFLWPHDETWAHLSGAIPELSHTAVSAACAIFEDVGLASRESAVAPADQARGRGGLVWQVQLLAVEGRKDLAGSLRYREGLRARQAAEAFWTWVLAASPADLVRAALA